MIPSISGTIRIWAGAALLALAGSAASTWQLAASREAHLHAAEQLALSLSNAAAQRIAVSLRSMDVMLASVAEKAGATTLPDPALATMLAPQLDLFPELDSVDLVDGSGWLRQVIYRDGPDRLVPLDISKTQHFRETSGKWRDNQLSLTPPVPEYFTKKIVVLLSRPVIGPDKTFRGQVDLAVMTSFIDEALASVVPEQGDAAGAFTPEGMLFSRQPRDNRFTAGSISDSGLYLAYSKVGGAGVSRYTISFVDGTPRIVGFTPVPNYPVITAVGINRDRVIDGWRRELWVHGGIQIIFIGVIIALALRLSRSEKRRLLLTQDMLAAERAHVDSLAQAVEARTAELNASLHDLSESEERFRRIVDISPLPLVLSRRLDNRIVYINARASDAFGIPNDQAEGKEAPDFWVHQDDRAKMIDDLAQSGQVRNQEALLKRANGERFTALLSGAEVTLRGENMVLVAVLDITERKRLEEDLSRSNRDLEQFSYAVSHDLQEPLRMVSSYLALLERRYKNKLDTDADEFIAFAVDGAQRMSRMITDLLEFSRVHRRGNPFAAVPLNDVLGDALANLSTAISECGAQVTAQPLPTVTGDASQLMRVFQNLIGNAVKYRKPDSTPHISVSAEQVEGDWVVSVADDGIGIDPAHVGRLFQVFQRLHPRGVYEGSGVGLALCRRILLRHSGRIWVDSPGEGQGSTFRFAIPLVPPPPPDSEIP